MAHGAVLQLHIEFNNGIICAWQVFLIELSKQLETTHKKTSRKLPSDCKVCDFHSLSSPESF